MTDNNAYIKVKIAQIDAQKTALRKQIAELDKRKKAYTDQLVTDQKSETQTD